MPRDRLKDVKKAGGPAGDDSAMDIESGFISDESVANRKFFEQVNEIKGLIEAISGNTTELGELYNANLTEPQESMRKSRTSRIERLLSDSNKAAISTRKKLSEMQKATGNLPDQVSADARMRSGQHSALTKRFVDVMGAYTDVQANSKKELRNRQKREFKIIKKEATDEEIENAIDNVSGPIFAQQIENMSQREEAKKLLADIQSRHEDILKLEESLRELRQLFLDMQTLVESQGEMLNEIENNVDKAVDYTDKGVQEMKSAVKLQKSARMKMFILLGCVCCLIVIVVVIPTAVVFGPKLSSSH